MQVWLAHADLMRLQHAAKRAGRSQSDIAREGILRLLEELDKEHREKIVLNRLFERFSSEAKKLISLAKDQAETQPATLVGSEHLLLALSADEGRTGKVLCKHGVSPPAVRAEIRRGMPSIYADVTIPPYSPTLVRIMDRARLIAKQNCDKYVQPEHLLLSVLDQGRGFAFDILEMLLGADRSPIREAALKQIALMRKEPTWRKR
jgi:ATP-dependent Clp protease ATP-binding subunit ClpA